MLRCRFLAAALVALPVAAQAQDDGTCRNGSFPTNNTIFGLAKVAGSARLAFLSDMDGCPNASARCRTRSYVVTGDTVLTGRTRGPFICAFFPNKGGGTAGWVETARLARTPVSARPPAAAWTGRWSAEGNPALRIALTGGRLLVQGEAYWPSADTDRPGGSHTGEVSGPLTISGNVAREPQCNIRFTLLGDLLVGSDPDMQCGGANVSFSEVYRRVRR